MNENESDALGYNRRDFLKGGAGAAAVMLTLPAVASAASAGGKPPKLFPGIPADWYSFGPATSTDGKKVVFAAVPPMQPAEPK